VFELVRILGAGEIQRAKTFALVFTAIGVEPFPFVLLDAVAAPLLEV
jgi:hypothetical protein